MLRLQSPLLTAANLVIGGPRRFVAWSILFCATAAITPFVVYSWKHPWLHLLDKTDTDTVVAIVIQLIMGIGIAIIFSGPAERVRQCIDGATTAPAQRRMESEENGLANWDPNRY